MISLTEVLGKVGLGLGIGALGAKAISNIYRKQSDVDDDEKKLNDSKARFMHKIAVGSVLGGASSAARAQLKKDEQKRKESESKQVISGMV